MILRFEAAGTAPASVVTNNIQDVTTEVGRENLKWSASSLFAGAPFHRALFMAFINPRDPGGSDTVGTLV